MSENKPTELEAFTRINHMKKPNKIDHQINLKKKQAKHTRLAHIAQAQLLHKPRGPSLSIHIAQWVHHLLSVDASAARPKSHKITQA